MILKLFAALALLAAGGWAWVNLAPGDPARWHADPVAAAGTGRPNEAFVRPDASPVYPEAPERLLRRLDAVALAEPRTARLAGDPAEGFVTYVQRSRLIGYPDYVSVRAIPEGDGARLAIWSRSRFGYSDLGVNRARVDRWTAALD